MVNRETTPPMLFPIWVVQYYRGDLPWHWAVMLRYSYDENEKCTTGLAYHAIGNMDTFRYNGGFVPTELETSADYRGYVEVGTLHEKDLDRFNELMETVPVLRNQDNWNCQNWVMGAIRKMQLEGWVGTHVTTRWICERFEVMYRENFSDRGDVCGPRGLVRF
jgi:hypothetical protein